MKILTIAEQYVNFLMAGGYTNAHKRTGQYPLPELHQFLKHETIEVLLPPLPPLDGTTPGGRFPYKIDGDAPCLT